jgi:NAD-dependent dihydropyrimidine dehydrogenase PreA subunit
MIEIKRKDGSVVRTIDADSLQGAYLQGADLRGADLAQCNQYVAVIKASRNSIVAIDDDICIGCQRMTLAEWLEQFEAVGRAAGYTQQQIAEYGIYLKAIRDVLEVRKNATTNE